MYEKYMKEALKEAKKALVKNEVPVGAVIVMDGKIIAKAHNTKDSTNSVVNHAEINAIRKASKYIDNWRLLDCIMVVTMLPCPMCASAINQSRMSKVVYGAIPNNVNSIKIEEILKDNQYGNTVKIEGKVLEEECISLLQNFFSKRRV